MENAREYKSKLLREVKQLSQDRIKALADFAAYLREREEWEETVQILGDKKTAQQIQRSRKAWHGGKKAQFISLDEIKVKLGV